MKLEAKITKVRNGVTYDWAYYGSQAGGVLSITDENGGSVSIPTQGDTPAFLEGFFAECKNELMRESFYQLKAHADKLLFPDRKDIPNT